VGHKKFYQPGTIAELVKPNELTSPIWELGWQVGNG